MNYSSEYRDSILRRILPPNDESISKEKSGIEEKHSRKDNEAVENAQKQEKNLLFQRRKALD